jgi:hypothetical protein
MKHYSVSREAIRKTYVALIILAIKQLVVERIQLLTIRRCNEREVCFADSDDSLEVQRPFIWAHCRHLKRARNTAFYPELQLIEQALWGV